MSDLLVVLFLCYTAILVHYMSEEWVAELFALLEGDCIGRRVENYLHRGGFSCIVEHSSALMGCT